MGGKIGVILLIIIIAGVALYVYNSGAIGKGVSYLNTLGNSSGTSSSEPSYFFGAPTAPSGGSTYVAPTPTPTTPAINPADIPAGFTASELSPYFDQVKFGGISAGSLYSYGQISLYAYPATASETIDVTGWEIKSNHGGEYLPQAVDVYDPLGLTPETNIVMKSGDELNLYSTSAPVNLRLNECLGYLPNRSQFDPELPQSCPYTDESAIRSFSGSCQNYIESLGSCQEADLSNPEIPQNDYSCITYLENNFNYKSCFEAHDNDANFLSNQIWAWTGSSPVDQLHDTVELLDRNGLLVDTYSY